MPVDSQRNTRRYVPEDGTLRAQLASSHCNSVRSLLTCDWFKKLSQACATFSCQDRNHVHVLESPIFHLYPSLSNKFIGLRETQSEMGLSHSLAPFKQPPVICCRDTKRRSGLVACKFVLILQGVCGISMLINPTKTLGM
jgi:hypothetical protein